MAYWFIAAPAGICDEMPMTGWVRSVVPLPPLSGTADAIREPSRMRNRNVLSPHLYRLSAPPDI